jgi:hypothetical protein
MRLSDIQPQYFPRLHYIARMLDSDVFILRDDVQFVRNHRYPGGARGPSYQVHTPIKSPEGAHLLTVAVKKKSGLSIRATEVSHDAPWARKHLNSIASFYRGAMNARVLLPEIEAIFARRYATVGELAIATTCWALGRILSGGLRVPDELSIERANALLAVAAAPGVRLRRVGLGSELLADSAACCASERIAELCRRVGADEYLAGGTALEAYLDRGVFERRGIAVAVQRFRCPSYPQQHVARGGEVANLSILDLLMNAPLERAAALLSARRADPEPEYVPSGSGGSAAAFPTSR